MRYKNLLIKSIIVSCLGVFGVIGFYNFEDKNTPAESARASVGLAIPGFENLKELASETETILVANVPTEYEVVESPIEGENSVYMVEHKYEITITKNTKSPSGTKLEKGQKVDLVIPVGMRQKLNGEIGGLIPLTDDLHEFTDGEYLLFLEEFHYQPTEKKAMTLKNFNHIYKKQGNKFINVSSDSIPEIDENVELENN